MGKIGWYILHVEKLTTGYVHVDFDCLQTLKIMTSFDDIFRVKIVKRIIVKMSLKRHSMWNDCGCGPMRPE